VEKAEFIKLRSEGKPLREEAGSKQAWFTNIVEFKNYTTVIVCYCSVHAFSSTFMHMFVRAAGCTCPLQN